MRSSGQKHDCFSPKTSNGLVRDTLSKAKSHFLIYLSHHRDNYINILSAFPIPYNVEHNWQVC